MSMQIPWKEGEGNIVITPGSNGTASVSSDVANEGLDREQTVVFRTTNSGVQASVSTTISQIGKRQAFAVALKDLGYSLNSTNIKELTEAKDLLVTQKPLVQAYVVDQVRDKMIGNEAAIGVIYSGEAIYTKRENPDLEYVVPKEGSNVWIDSW